CVWQSRNSAAIPSIAILAHEQNLLIAALHFRLRLVKKRKLYMRRPLCECSVDRTMSGAWLFAS
ncbi:MAG: hypothetical protein RR824_07890, partial [Clostridia bacterium]